MARITDAGVEIDRLDKILSEFEAGFKAIYGQGIDVSPESADGQLIGLLSQMKADMQELLINIYRQVDPDLATGAWLEQRSAYAGLERKQATHSYLRSVILLGTQGAVIPKGTVVQDGNKAKWLLVSDITLGEHGSARGDFKSEFAGAYPLPANSQLEIITHTSGFESATTTDPAQLGVERETDEQLRQRFYRSRARSASVSTESIAGKLLALPDVKQAVVLENYTNKTDSRGVAGHTINAIVDGGDDEAIANVLYENKALGVGIQGAVEITLYRNNGHRIIRFDRASKIDLVVNMVLVRNTPDIEIDTDKIKQALTDLKFNIGQEVQYSRLYTPINSVQGFWVKSLQIGKNAGDLVMKNITLSPREQARILNANITIDIED